jgi:sulfur-carrier protein
MPIQVRIPTPLRKLTGGAESVAASGTTIAAIMQDLESRHPGLKERICDDNGKVRRFVNVYVNGDDIRFLDNLETAVKEGDEISIVPAIAGGGR